MDGKYIKEYELTYNEEEINSFFEELYYTNIIPVTYESSECYRVQRQIWQAENFDKMNTLKDQNDIKEYIYRLHESSMMDLTQLAILMKSNGAMRSNQVREIFRNYLNLYNYSLSFRVSEQCEAFASKLRCFRAQRARKLDKICA